MSSRRAEKQPSERASARLSARSSVPNGTSARSTQSTARLEDENEEEPVDADVPEMDTDDYKDEHEPVSNELPSTDVAQPSNSSRVQQQPEQQNGAEAALDEEWPADDDEEQQHEEPAPATDDEPYEDVEEPATLQPTEPTRQAEEERAEEKTVDADDEYADEYTVEQSVVEEQPAEAVVDEQPSVEPEEQQTDEYEDDYADEPVGANDELPEDETAATAQPEEEQPAAAVPHIAPLTKHKPKPSLHKPVTARPGPEVEEEERPVEVHHEVDEDVQQQQEEQRQAAERRKRKEEKSSGRKERKHAAHQETREQEVEEEQRERAYDEAIYEDEQRDDSETQHKHATSQRQRASSQRRVDVVDDEEVAEERHEHGSQRDKPSTKRVVIAPGVKSPSSSHRTSIKRQPSTLLPHVHRSPSHSNHHQQPQHSHHGSDDQHEAEEEDLTEYIQQLEDQNRLLQTRVRSLTKKQSLFAAQSSLLSTSTTIHGYSDRISELEHLLSQERQERRTVERTVKRLEKDLVLADQQHGSMPQVLERMTAEVGREKERGRRLREQSDEKDREVRRMVLRAVEMEKRMRVMERMLLDHRASMGRKDGRAEEAKEREEEGRIEGEVQEYREQMRQLHGEFTAQGAQRETLKSTPIGRRLLRTLDQKQAATTKPSKPSPPPAPTKRPPVYRQPRPVNNQPPPKPKQRYGALIKKPRPQPVPSLQPAAHPTRAPKLLSPTRGGNSRFPNVTAIRADLKRSKARADAVQAAMSPRSERAAVTLPRPLKAQQLDRYPTHIPTLKAQVTVTSATGKGKEGAGLEARAVGNGPSQAAPALAAVMASIDREAEEHRRMLQVRRESQLSGQAASSANKGWKGEERKEQLNDVEEEKTTLKSSRTQPAAIAAVKSARDDYGIEDEVADEAVAADDEYGDDFDS